MNPKKLSSDINKKFCDVEEEQQVVATTMDNFSKGVATKSQSKSGQNLPCDSEKTQFALDSLQISNERSAIAAPFMPISGQISIEFGKLTIPHITCASCKSRGEYESIDVEIQDEKLPEKSADNKDER
ncbi:hypothetical protein LOAG_15111 [Loa loa]|uniref:Uncharacterized protein n=1 Tax=Loa loa TaxID=7209 RepID=A0A1S0TGY6_LOALO|nr:hypothetical protein LOAG_15111 [Loa loa]EFO13418.1 hypothetical protein LOAG_15111 [Loa loa]